MAELSLNLKKKMYAEMLRIRMSEEKLIELWNQDLIHSPMHLSIGQEAVAVGVCGALKKGDLIFSNHRCHAHYLAKGGDMKAMYAELLGREDGCASGRSGSMHLLDPVAGLVLSTPIVGGGIPIGVGSALSAKYKKIKRVSVIFLGDGALEEGVFWESLNFASVNKLPVVFVCENNGYATHTPLLKRQPNDNIISRIIPHAVYAKTVDGNDVKKVYEDALVMVNRAKSGRGPSFLEAKTYRWKEHWGAGEDWHLGYRSKKEGETWKKRCPIKMIESDLRKTDIPSNYFKTIQVTIDQEIKKAL